MKKPLDALRYMQSIFDQSDAASIEAAWFEIVGTTSWTNTGPEMSPYHYRINKENTGLDSQEKCV